MRISLPRIYPITDRQISGLSHYEQVRLLIAGGARLIQLREKHLPARQFYEDAEQALVLARGTDVKIIINDRIDIAMALHADGVHLGQDDVPPAYARKLLGRNAIIGRSTHTLEQSRVAANEPVDYIAFGPVFSTETKDNPEPVVGIEMLAAVRAEVAAWPLVAIGGITMANINDVFQAGADSAALIRQIVSDAHRITEKMRELIEHHGV